MESMCVSCIWLPLLSIFLRFMNNKVGISTHSFLLLKSILVYAYTIFCCLYALSVDGHLDYFQFGATMTNAAMKICFHVFVWRYALFWTDSCECFSNNYNLSKLLKKIIKKIIKKKNPDFFLTPVLFFPIYFKPIIPVLWFRFSLYFCSSALARDSCRAQTKPGPRERKEQ